MNKDFLPPLPFLILTPLFTFTTTNTNNLLFAMVSYRVKEGRKDV